MSKSNTGRFYVRSFQTGKLYCVEPIGQPRTEFGASLTDFCKGSIRAEASIIENGFTNIGHNGFTNIGHAQNPLDYIEALEKGKKPKDDQY